MDENFFTVLPMSQRFSISAGGTYHGSIKVANPAGATSDFSYIVSVAPYTIIDNQYNTDFHTSGPRTAIADWITIENPTGTLSPNDIAEVNFTITVPEGVPAGGQYAALVVSRNPESSAGEGVNVESVLQLASIVYADVSGVTVRDGAILANHIPGFSLEPSVILDANIENKGNVHSDATFSIKVTNNLTGDVIFPTEGGSDTFQEIIMPESTRFITRRVDNLPQLGIVHITQTIYFYDRVSTTERDVIICPLWFIFLTFFTVASIAVAIVMRIRSRRRRKFVG